MRINLDLDARLLVDAKRHAAELGQTLETVIEDAVRELLVRRHAAAKSRLAPSNHGVADREPALELDDGAPFRVDPLAERERDDS